VSTARQAEPDDAFSAPEALQLPADSVDALYASSQSPAVILREIEGLRSVITARRPRRRTVDAVVRRLSRTLGADPQTIRLALGCVLLRDLRLLELAPERALRAQLRTVVALGPVIDASVWTRGADGSLDCLARCGDVKTTRRVLTEAMTILRERRDTLADLTKRGVI